MMASVGEWRNSEGIHGEKIRFERRLASVWLSTVLRDQKEDMRLIPDFTHSIYVVPI